MDKKSFEWHGKNYYLLGVGRDNEAYYLEEAHWDCGWYWGLGYVETFTNKKNPRMSKDISSHSHFNYMFMNGELCAHDEFENFFTDTPLTNKEIWTLVELMMSAYNARTYSDMLHSGGAYQATNPCKDIIVNKQEYDRINNEVIPAINEKVYELLKGEC